MTYTAAFVGLSIGNFLWQLFQTTPDWSAAFDRCFFQGVALLAAWIIS